MDPGPSLLLSSSSSYQMVSPPFAASSGKIGQRRTSNPRKHTLQSYLIHLSHILSSMLLGLVIASTPPAPAQTYRTMSSRQREPAPDAHYHMEMIPGITYTEIDNRIYSHLLHNYQGDDLPYTQPQDEIQRQIHVINFAKDYVKLMVSHFPESSCRTLGSTGTSPTFSPSSSY